jgi:hypothetical protein
MKMNGFAYAVKNKPNQTQLQTHHPIFQKNCQKPLFPNFSNLRQKDRIVFAVKLGAFRAGGVEEIKFLQVPGLRVDIDLHLVYPLSDVLVRPFKDLG